MRVLAIHFQPGQVLSACQIYRTNLPYYYLNQHGWQAEWDNWNYIKMDYEQRGKVAFLDLVKKYDIFVFPRLTAAEDTTLEGLGALFELIHLARKRIIYEVDDDFTNKHRDLTGMGVHRAVDLAKAADAVTVTTPYLAETMRKATSRPVHVIPNMVGPELWRKPENYTEHPLTIGLTGSQTHYYDWMVLKDVLPRLAEEFPELRILVAGFFPNYLRELPNIISLPPTAYDDYVEIVRQCDIVLAPVDPEDKFNDSKSPIKVIEGMAASRPVGNTIGGAATIATGNKVYKLAVEHNRNGLLCTQTPEAWYTAIHRLITNPEELKRLQLAGHQWVWKRHDASTQWVEWARAYNKVMARPMNSIVLQATA